YLASVGSAVVLWDPYTGGFLSSRGALLNWITDAKNHAYAAQVEIARIEAELADVAPYRLTLASGEPLGKGLVNDTAADTLEVDSATPLQTALTLHATNGQDSADTRLWLQVNRFDGVTRVGTDEEDHLVAEGPHPNLLAGGRGSDTYVVRNSSDLVVENPGEGIDTVTGLGLRHTLAEHVENLTLAHDGQAAAASPTLHGTG